MFRLCLFFLFLLVSGPLGALGASDRAQLQTLIAQAKDLQLSERAQWKGLLHYRGAARRSELRQGPFFLSADGAVNPSAELEATLAAAFAPIGTDVNTAVACRYPARMRYLQDELEWTPPLQPVCPDLQRWRRNGDVKGISLVFVSGDLSNPASFFGHILMKFNEDGEGNLTTDDLNNRSVNFGALVPENENPVSYLVRGLVGGYPSSYSSTSYFEQRHDYGEDQLRDMWEYRLNLSEAQVRLLVDHTWELQDARNTYYFLTRNCAYEFAQLLALAVDGLSLPQIKLWSTPADLFESLSGMTTATGAPLVAGASLVASRQRSFRQAFASLTDAEQQTLDALLSALDAGDSAPADFQAKAPESQSRILEVALQYTRFGREKHEADSTEAISARQMQRQVALLRLQQPAGAALAPAIDDIAAPTQGHRSSLLQITALSHSRLGEGIEIRLRPAYSDLLSLDAGALPNGGVAMGEIRFLLRDDELSLRQLDLIRIAAFNVSPTALPFDRESAWTFRIGVEDRDLACDQCPVGFVEGGYGTSLALGDTAALALFAQGRGITDDDLDGAFEAGPNIQLVGSLGTAFKLAATARHLTSIGMDGNDRFEAAVDIRFGDSQTSDLRLGVRHLQPSQGQGNSEVGLSASFFF